MSKSRTAEASKEYRLTIGITGEPQCGKTALIHRLATIYNDEDKLSKNDNDNDNENKLSKKAKKKMEKAKKKKEKVKDDVKQFHEYMKKIKKEVKGSNFTASCNVKDFGIVWFNKLDRIYNPYLEEEPVENEETKKKKEKIFGKVCLPEIRPQDQEVVIYCIDMTKPGNSQFNKLWNWYIGVGRHLKPNAVLILVGTKSKSKCTVTTRQEEQEGTTKEGIAKMLVDMEEREKQRRIPKKDNHEKILLFPCFKKTSYTTCSAWTKDGVKDVLDMAIFEYKKMMITTREQPPIPSQKLSAGVDYSKEPLPELPDSIPELTAEEEGSEDPYTIPTEMLQKMAKTAGKGNSLIPSKRLGEIADGTEDDYLIPSELMKQMTANKDNYLLPSELLAEMAKKKTAKDEDGYYVPSAVLAEMAAKAKDDYLIPSEALADMATAGEEDEYLIPSEILAKTANKDGDYLIPSELVAELVQDKNDAYLVPSELLAQMAANTSGDYLVPSELVTEMVAAGEDNYLVPSELLAKMAADKEDDYLVPNDLLAKMASKNLAIREPIYGDFDPIYESIPNLKRTKNEDASSTREDPRCAPLPAPPLSKRTRKDKADDGWVVSVEKSPDTPKSTATPKRSMKKGGPGQSKLVK